jgi:predicted transglutaminase-like cysteine proteinase
MSGKKRNIVAFSCLTLSFLHCAFGTVSPVSRINFEKFEAYYVSFAAANLQLLASWQAVIDDVLPHDKDDHLVKLAKVNEFAHRHFTYAEDKVQFGKEDYWASPAELLASRLGDCEDWAIFNYISLRHMGIPEQQMRLVYVRAAIGGAYSSISQAHMVLAYYPVGSDEPLIIDSLIADILPASQRTDLTPVFSFNADGLWVGTSGQKSRQSSSARLSHWREVIARMEAQGVNF